MPTFHAFAEDWWVRREHQLAASTRADYKWRLEVHLLDFFGEMPLDAIGVDAVDRYVAAKLAADNPLSGRSINMTLTLLGAILEDARERELIDRNPARGRRRKAREKAPVRSALDTAGQITALLRAAGELDRNADGRNEHLERRAMLATLTFAGLRIGELLALRWRDVDLANGWLTVGESKTDAGVRKVRMRGALRDELLVVRSKADADPDGLVFSTRRGKQIGAENFRNRILATTIGKADEKLSQAGEPPLPAKLTQHSLRRTFASVLYALGEAPPVVMAEMGHTDPGMALAVYAQALRLSESERDKLRTLVDGASFRPIEADQADLTETLDPPREQQTARTPMNTGRIATKRP